jgi:hypothetical protein
LAKGSVILHEEDTGQVLLLVVFDGNHPSLKKRPSRGHYHPGGPPVP